MLNAVVKFFHDEEGASAVEYGLIMGLVGVALIVVLGVLSGGLNSLFSAAATALTAAIPS